MRISVELALLPVVFVFLIFVQITFVSMIHSQINCLQASMFILYNRNILKLDNLVLTII